MHDVRDASHGDLDRAAQNNESLGVGQISQNFLNNGPWSRDGPGNARVGSQDVTTAEYMNSPTIQVRTAAANLAMRVADKGGLENGMAYYVNGSPDTSQPKAADYISNINAYVNNPQVEAGVS
ncbi:hypothetical protein R69746_08224 [Paraburkholderia aspalathi]|uniref:hypothetical protein n=1 Tax=Paraburkholderia aspalathi TaxID=1324617 RepID=UPI00190DCC71|nr:hypothetical protein [Paraburkholderia aspalathi]MBK3844142.1 hypothetical protein [Paraburkholderia aspalathi]CAE6867959.1 hypothetical protein R69746_08224 [Paraburkholderia aspalathi]